MLSGAGYWAYQIWKEAEEAAVLSCLSSIAAGVGRAWNAGKLEVADKPRELTQSEIELVLSESQYLDCRDKSNLSRDVHIAVGSVNERSPSKIKVWTNGDDAVAGTDDDLVIPYGEKVK